MIYIGEHELSCFVYLCHHPPSHFTKLFTRTRFFGPCHCSYIFVPCRSFAFMLPPCRQGCSKFKWRPVQEASLAPPSSNLRSFGSKCSVLKKVFVTLSGLFGAPIVIRRPGNCAPLAPLVTTLLTGDLNKTIWFVVGVLSTSLARALLGLIHQSPFF